MRRAGSEHRSRSSEKRRRSGNPVSHPAWRGPKAPGGEDGVPVLPVRESGCATVEDISSSGRIRGEEPCPPPPPRNRRVQRTALCPTMENTGKRFRRRPEPSKDSSSSATAPYPQRTAAKPRLLPGSARELSGTGRLTVNHGDNRSPTRRGRPYGRATRMRPAIASLVVVGFGHSSLFPNRGKKDIRHVAHPLPPSGVTPQRRRPREGDGGLVMKNRGIGADGALRHGKGTPGKRVRSAVLSRNRVTGAATAGTGRATAYSAFRGHPRGRWRCAAPPAAALRNAASNSRSSPVNPPTW